MLVTAIRIVLALATLGDVTQMGLFLFLSLHPRCPRQVSNDCRCRQRYHITFTNVNDPLSFAAKCIFTRKSDFTLCLQVYNTNNTLKWTSLLQNCALKSDV
jgi:hypothetical protein